MSRMQSALKDASEHDVRQSVGTRAAGAIFLIYCSAESLTASTLIQCLTGRNKFGGVSDNYRFSGGFAT